jgi:hypothetical protein
MVLSGSPAGAEPADGVIEPGEDEVAELHQAVQNPVADLILPIVSQPRLTPGQGRETGQPTGPPRLRFPRELS